MLFMTPESERLTVSQTDSSRATNLHMAHWVLGRFQVSHSVGIIAQERGGGLGGGPEKERSCAAEGIDCGLRDALSPRASPTCTRNRRRVAKRTPCF